MRRLLSLLVVVWACCGLFAPSAAADCYEFALAATPDSLTLHKAAPSRASTWCYERSMENGLEATFVYQAGGQVRAELAALIKRNAAGDIQTLTHGSMLQGKVTLHATADFMVNPMPVPLDEKEAKTLGKKVTIVTGLGFRTGLRALRRQFSELKAKETIYKVEAGTFEENVAETSLPYAAFWWPYSTHELSSGPFSPLGKYDEFVKATTGGPSDAAGWEFANHSYDVVEWGGHCNGWAASSLLHKEIDGPRWSEKTKTVIHNNDINGMYAEASFCVDWAFYGVRNYGDGDLEDVSAVKFHKVLIYYIKQLKKPVALDYFRTDAVDNNVIGGYKFTIVPVPDVPNQFQVTAVLNARNYDVYRNDALGVATPRAFFYQYILEVDAENEIIGGRWTGGDNPDFLWVPLSQANCGRENPRLKPNRIAEMAELPKAARRTDAAGWSVSAPLTAGQSVAVLGEVAGSAFTLKFGEVTLPAGVNLVARGHMLSPNQWNKGAQEMVFNAANFNQGTWSLAFDRLESLSIRNDSGADVAAGSFTLNSIEYWGPPL